PRGHLGPVVGAVAVDAAAVIRRLGERRRDLLALTARRSAVAPVIVLAVTATAFALAAISPLDPLAAHLGSAYQFTGSAGRVAPSRRQPPWSPGRPAWARPISSRDRPDARRPTRRWAYQFTGSAGREAAHTALGLSVHGIGRTRGGPHGAGPGHPVVAGLVA